MSLISSRHAFVIEALDAKKLFDATMEAMNGNKPAPRPSPEPEPGPEPEPEPSIPTLLKQDGQTYYKTKVIDGKTFIIEAIELTDGGDGIYYANDDASYDPSVYGLLYRWDAVERIVAAHPGWRVITWKELIQLFESVDGVKWNGNSFDNFENLMGIHWAEPLNEKGSEDNEIQIQGCGVMKPSGLAYKDTITRIWNSDDAAEDGCKVCLNGQSGDAWQKSECEVERGISLFLVHD